LIKQVSDLLRGLAEEEARKLASYKLKHAPTIGLMYEGLTADILNRALPPQLNLQVVSGFVTDDTDILSPQIDSMIVHGEGEQVPHTSIYKWHVKDVIATLEVKKTLYSAGIADAYSKLREVMENFGRHALVPNRTFIDSAPLISAFNRITSLNIADVGQIDSLSYHHQIIFHTLAIEWVSPIRIVIGYDGFASEARFANALVDLLSRNLGTHGFGVMGMPQLCISGQYSIVKMNAHPYVPPLHDGWWPFLASSRTNPLRILLELIWTRLDFRFAVGMPWGDDEDDEIFTPFLLGRGVDLGDRQGWEMKQVAFLAPNK
jgi:hypothetical protein